MTAVAAVMATLAASAEAVSFRPAVNYTAGTTPIGVAVGHFNADANADLAVANLSTNNVSIMLGTGTGTFGASTNFSVGAATLPRGIAIGDFNGDSKEDLVTANSNGNNVSILLGTGTGTFGAAATIAAGTGPRQVAVADLNGDGKQDLAVANATTNNVSILLGTGTGTFGAATNFAVGTSPRSVAIADFDGDSKLDLAVVNATTNNLSVLLGNGAGSFGSATNFAVGTDPRMVVTGDFNGDSAKDLAVANNVSNNVSILLGTGAGSFGAATSFAAGTGPVAIAKADFNGDSEDDLGVANNGSNNFTALLGDGSGGFASATNFATTGAPAWIATGQFNAGPQPDVAVPGGTTLATSFVSVLLAKSEPSLSTTADATANAGNSIHDSATISGGTSPTGTITFTAYGPDDGDCSGTPAFVSSPVNVDTGNGNYQSPSFTPEATGTYRWIASYSGDADNAGTTGACNDSGESSVVSKAAPSLSTNATPTAAPGQAIHDSATLTGGTSPTGTITFAAYGPGDASCSGTPAFTSSPVNVDSGNGIYQSPSFTPGSQGTYRWIATYSGDASNQSTAGSCNDAGESSVVGSGDVTSTLTPDTAVSPSTGLKTGGGNSIGLFLQTKTCIDGDSACTSDPFSPASRPPNVKTETLYFSKQVLLPSGTSIAKVPSCNPFALALASSSRQALSGCSPSAIGQGQASACYGGGIGDTCATNRRADVSVFKLANSGTDPQLGFYVDLGNGSSPAMGGNLLLVGTVQSVPKGPLTVAGYAKQLVVQVPNTSGAGMSLTSLFTDLAFGSLFKVNCASTPGTSNVIKYAASFNYWQGSYADDFNSRTQSCSTAAAS